MKPIDSLRERLATDPLREVGGKLYFREVDVAGETTDSFDRIKLFFKKFPRFYYFLIHVFSPVCSDQRPLKRFLASAEKIRDHFVLILKNIKNIEHFLPL